MKRIVSVSMGSSQRDYAISTTVDGIDIQIERIGTNGSMARVVELVQSFNGKVDAISLGKLTPTFQVGKLRYVHCPGVHSAARGAVTPVVDGSRLKATLERWTAKRAADVMPDMFRSRRVLFLSGIDRYQLAQAILPHAPVLRFADPIIQMGLPFLPALTSLKQLETYVAMMLPLTSLPFYRSLHQQRKRHQSIDERLAKLFAWAEVIVGDFESLDRYAPPTLENRVIITDDPSPEEIARLRERGVTTLVTMTPPLCNERPFVGTDVLEAIVTVLHGQSRPPDEAAVLDFISRHGWEPTLQCLNEPRKKPAFAFVVHPLKTRHLFFHPRFHLLRYLPPRLVEWGAAYAPPLYLARIRGIRSKATGEDIEGILLSLGATPREMMRRSPSFTYKRLLHAARIAELRGARIMGLGAFTSVVGDAGITVAKQSNIGITSGNSLTVAATLEAAKRAVLLMGGRIDCGRAVVIGATGSIGAVCARLLAQAIGDVVLIAPRPERLLALKLQIERETPGVRVTAAMSPDPYIGDADLIVTTTNTLQGGVINIERLKPGAVICDVARPPNVCPEEATRRPDVLVIESGEVCLPGQPDLGFNLDLPSGTTYACLAETALLAMDGRFESYTLGRDIEMERVKEMYRLMKKHGIELAHLRSFGHTLTDEEIAEKRRLAQALREQREAPVC